MKLLHCLFLLVFLHSNAFGQTPYTLDIKKEVVLFGGGIAASSLGLLYRAKTPLFTDEEILQLDIQDINRFDREATRFFSTKAHSASNYFWYGSHLLPLLFLADKESLSDIVEIGTMYGEAAIITTGLTLLTKYSVRRARPFNYDPNTGLDKKQTSNAKGSFFSGHTSLTSVNCFFMAKVFSDYFPESKWRPVVWSVAAAIPAVTGYLRVRGGKHYPTDVIVGYAVGAGVGLLIPQLHKSVKQENNMSLSIGYNSALLSWKF